MEHLSHKPYYLTDEDILWVGNTLADMMPAPCAGADAVKQALSEGRAAMFFCVKWDADALENYRTCIDAGAMYARVSGIEFEEAKRILCDDLGFNGIVYIDGEHGDDELRASIIQNLSLQAALGLHKL